MCIRDSLYIEPSGFGGDAQSPPLAHGVTNDSGVLAQDVSGLIQKRTRGEIKTGVPADKGGIVAVWDKADVLAVPLFGGGQPRFTGDGPHLSLIHISIFCPCSSVPVRNKTS